MVESKIKELWDQKETVYFFDVDGVLAPIEYGEYTHYYYDDEKWAKALLEQDIYEEVRPSKYFQEFIQNKDLSRIYAITKIMNEEEKQQKINFLKRNYHMLEDHVLAVYHDEEKLEKMKEIQKNYPNLPDKYFVIIDDTVSILNDVMEHSHFSTAHVSSFLK